MNNEAMTTHTTTGTATAMNARRSPEEVSTGRERVSETMIVHDVPPVNGDALDDDLGRYHRIIGSTAQADPDDRESIEQIVGDGRVPYAVLCDKRGFFPQGVTVNEKYLDRDIYLVEHWPDEDDMSERDVALALSYGDLRGGYIYGRWMDHRLHERWLAIRGRIVWVRDDQEEARRVADLPENTGKIVATNFGYGRTTRSFFVWNRPDDLDDTDLALLCTSDNLVWGALVRRTSSIQRTGWDVTIYLD